MSGTDLSFHVVQTVPTTRADYGGPSRSVPFLCEGLAGQGVSVRLVTTIPGAGEEAKVVIPREPVATHTVEERGVSGSTVGFYRTLRTQIETNRPQLIHDHGLWLPQNAISAFTAWQSGVPLVITPRGMLEPWALQHKAWKKQVAWWTYQRWLLEQADLLHATADAEAESLRQLGFEQPIAVIPNGVNLPEQGRLQSSRNGRHRALFLSRLHPKKGLPMLIEAWADVRPQGWQLVLVGPSEDGHRAELETMAQQRGVDEAFRFVGPVDDEEKWSYYADADLFVLPTHSENFGIVVAEALAANVPVITTTGAPWEELKTHDCGWWVEPDVESIAGALQEAVQCTPEQRRGMGVRGRQLVKERYSWEGVAAQMEATYRWLVDGGARPDCVRLN